MAASRIADALIAGAYLAGTNTRRVRRALRRVFGGEVGKDTVSRVWRKVKGDWDAWNSRSLAEEPIVRLILDGTVVGVRLDRKATSISPLVVIGVGEDGQTCSRRSNKWAASAGSRSRSPSRNSMVTLRLTT
jgi:putative transposase